MIIFVDGDPRKDLQTEFMPDFDGSRKTIELGIIHRVDHFRDRAIGMTAPLVIHVETLQQRLLLFCEWIIKLIKLVVLRRENKPALVHRATCVQHAPIDLRHPSGLANR